MSKHLHSRTEYCWNCGSVAVTHCKVCSMPICLACSIKYHGKCDVCADDIKEENLMLGSIDNGYNAVSDNSLFL